MVPTNVAVLSEVDVWCASTARWVPGFRVAAVRDDGRIEILGRDGGPPLPVAFDRRQLRPTEHLHRSPWAGLAPTAAGQHTVRS
jgi:hypothetical protein